MKVICPKSILIPFLLLHVLLLGPAAGFGQSETDTASQKVLDLSVEEVALLVLQNNRDLRVQRLNPVIAGAFEKLERGAFDPELFVQAEYAEEKATETARSTGTQFEVDGSDSAIAAGVSQFLPTGTSVDLTVDQSRSISNRAPEQQVARLGLTVTQALLQGFGPAVNLAAVRQAELGTVASRYELRGFVETLLAEAEIAYWNFVLAQEQIAIFESSLEVAREQRNETELRIEVGLLPEVEAAAARAEVARREQALIAARSLLEERRLRLLRLLSPADSFNQRINATSQPRMRTEPVKELPERLQLAEKMRPELNEARMRMQQRRLETVVTRNGLLPRLDFFVTLGKTGYADTFDDAFRELDGDNYDLVAGIRLSRALGNTVAEARDLAARTTLRQAEEALANLRQLVLLDVHLAANDLERTRQQIAASAATRDLQEQTLAAEQERFEVGTSTTLLVSQAQRDLLVSQIAEVEAIVNHRIALVNLFLAEGTLLERRGIDLGP
ncbi:MAG: TolC family protein [Syntrophotaleaceae bacterium]